MSELQADILRKIAEKVRERIDEDRIKGRFLPSQTGLSRTPRDFTRAFPRDGQPHIIAEIKRGSPSEGPIAPGADPVQVATSYLASGASALSVLTERDHFLGDPAFLLGIRRAHPESFLLMKDFVIDEFQLDQALGIGADAILLIVALLEAEETKKLLQKAMARGLTALVEVHDEGEMRVAVEAGATLIGVNNRNLKTLSIDLGTSERLAPMAPADRILIAESGLKQGDDARKLARLGFRGFLVGTSFMKTSDPGAALARFLREAQ